MARLTVTAKPIKWEQTEDSFWADSEYGFTIREDHDFDRDACFIAVWGEEEICAFATLEEAQAQCQEEIDDWVKAIAVVDLKDMELPMTDPLFVVGQKIRLKHKSEISWEIEEVDQVNQWVKLKGVSILPSFRECEWWTWAPYDVLEPIVISNLPETR